MRAPMRVTFYNRYSRFWRRNVPTLLNRKHPITEGLRIHSANGFSSYSRKKEIVGGYAMLHGLSALLSFTHGQGVR